MLDHLQDETETRAGRNVTLLAQDGMITVGGKVVTDTGDVDIQTDSGDIKVYSDLSVGYNVNVNSDDGNIETNKSGNGLLKSNVNSGNNINLINEAGDT